ncbi:MAG: helix-turn-helix transcriptional regulator [Bacteroidota bacterium]|nr:helix-turn-helix transcriptional regulator [Bacteroidota bacterium]
MESDFTRQQKPVTYAEHLGISEKHLNELSKTYTGKKISEVIHERLMLEAKRLLLHSALSVKEIGYFLSFEDPSYFTRFFKRKAGKSPARFRNEIRKAYTG